MVSSSPSTWTFEGGFSRRPLQAKIDGAGRSLSVNWEPRGETVTGILRRMVALRMPRGVEDDPAMVAQWFEHLRASATAMEPPRDGADDGPARGSAWTVQVVKAIIKCSGEMQNDLRGKRLVANFLEWCDTPLIRKPCFSTTNGRDRG